MLLWAKTKAHRKGRGGIFINNFFFIIFFILYKVVMTTIYPVSDAVEDPVVFGIGYLDLLAAVYPGT